MATFATNLSLRFTGQASSGSFRSFWRDFLNRAFNPYRPELHYMRGPGPAWRAKYGDQATFRLKSGEL
jgi:hypothetical protein